MPPTLSNALVRKGLVFAIAMLWTTHPFSLSAQRLDIETQIEQFGEGTAGDQINNVRSLSMLVLRDLANVQEQNRILQFLKGAVGAEEPVVRLTVHVELLKIGASNQDQELISLAMKAANDDNLNVRRGILQNFGAFFARRLKAGLSQKELLIEKLDDPDLESRYQVATTLLSWDLADDKVINILLDCLQLTNYRASITYGLSQLPNRDKIIEMAYARFKENEHSNGGILVNMIAQMGKPAAPIITELLENFENHDSSVRAALLSAIPKVGLTDKKSVALVRKAAADTSPEIRALALTSLLKASGDADDVANMVAKLLQDPEPIVRNTAASFVAMDSQNFSRYENQLRELLNSNDPLRISTALSALGAAGPIATNLTFDVAKILDSVDPELSVGACWTLLEMAGDKPLVADVINRHLAKQQDINALTANLLGALAETRPTDGNSKRNFLKNVEDSDPNIRFACVYGLTNFDASDFAKTILNLPGRPNQRVVERHSQLDQFIVQSIVKLGDDGATLAAQYISPDTDIHIRSRAIRILAQTKPNDPAVQTQITELLDSKEPAIRFAAADSLKYFPQVSTDKLLKLFDFMDGYNRQITVAYLQLISQLEEKAVPLLPRLAEFLSGKYNGRFSNDTKKAIMSLTKYVQHPVPELAKGSLTVQKLDCLAAIGKLDPAAIENLKKFIGKQRSKRETLTNLNQIRIVRRNELMAMSALANASGDYAEINSEIMLELQNDSADLAFLTISKLKNPDQTIIDALVARLPEAASMEALAEMNGQAKSAVAAIRSHFHSSDARIAALARRSVWKILDDPELALQFANEILTDNRLQPGDIKANQRQWMWELLRHLHDKHRGQPKVQQFLTSVRNGRFPNLRNFIRSLELENQ